MSISRVAILVIGDEILSGDTREANAHYMATRLADVGADLGRIVIIPDDLDEIARFVSRLAAEFDVVVTCGGIGPTHDDLTMEGVARAFDVPLAVHPQLAELLQQWRGGDLDDSHRRLARVPEGVTLLWTDKYFPLVQMRNVYILPGVPRLLRQKFDGLLPRIHGERRYQRQFRTDATELTITTPLGEVQASHPTVSIGSYPFTEAPKQWAVRLVLKARDAAALDAACADLTARLPDLTELPNDAVESALSSDRSS